MTARFPERPFDDAYLLAYSEEHVFYEFDMFLWSAELRGSGARLIARSPADLARLNSALTEIFVVHLRNVIDFFYPGPGKPWSTDVVAADFCGSGMWQPTTSVTLKDAHQRADKELAHLTTARIPGSPSGKEWDSIGLSAELRTVMRCFVKKALPSRLAPKVAAVISEGSA